MFSKETYIQRRKNLVKAVSGGVILLPGNVDVPMNYMSNAYRFRQDSNFLYFFGLDQQGMAGVIDADSGEEIVFGDDHTLDDIIWMGPQPPLSERAGKAGVGATRPFEKLSETLDKARKAGRTIHFLPPYRAENKLLLQALLGLPPEKQQQGASAELIKAIVALRSVKEDQEVAEIEKAIDVAWNMHTTAMRMAKPGVYEHEIAGVVEGIAIAGGGMLSFPLILSVHGETLHNHSHRNKLEKGQLLLMDGGAESAMHYATDHTRTMPVGGQFSSRQKEIYGIVLEAQEKAIRAMAPGKTFKSIHLLAARTIAEGLKQLGLMKGNADDAVDLGAHALFMPHGLGHMMGLDVHDMEDLGEDYVGYDDKVKRSDIFGTAFLRMGRELEKGFVLTVEPGIYFIPALYEQWKREGRFREYIAYDKVQRYLGFGGIRIEDDVLVTADGHRVLGRPIPRSVPDVERMMASG